MREAIQRRVACEHLPAPGAADDAKGIGVVGWIDETSAAKKGDKTPGVQRQHCGATGKIDNCIVTVHLAVHHGQFMTMLDSELFLPEKTWNQDRERCRAAHIPDSLVYRPKSAIALEQIKRAISNGVRFDWLTFDEWYGSKPAFLEELEAMGLLYVCEVPKHLPCFPTLPKYRSLQRPFQSKRADSAVLRGKPFRGTSWKKLTLQRQTLPPKTHDSAYFTGGRSAVVLTNYGPQAGIDAFDVRASAPRDSISRQLRPRPLRPATEAGDKRY